MSRILELREAHQIGIAPWMVETFDEPEAATEPAFLQRVDPTPTRPEAAPPPAIDVQQLLQEAAARSRQELEQAIQRTRQECEARAQARIEQEIEPWLRRMAQSIEDIATVKQRFLLDSEEQLVRLAVAIARRILYREIQIDGETTKTSNPTSPVSSCRLAWRSSPITVWNVARCFWNPPPAFSTPASSRNWMRSKGASSTYLGGGIEHLTNSQHHTL
jgi:hypothetical protein